MNNNINLFSLENQVIIITGGYGYLGSTITQFLAQQGATVYVLGKSIEKFNASICAENSQFVPCDISSTSQIQEAFKTIFEKEGQINGLINNAFYLKGQHPENITDEEWSYTMEGSLNSVYTCIREIIPFFKQQNSGNIINVSSMYGIVSPHFEAYDDYPESFNPPHYGVAKAGIIQITKYYANYLSKYNVRVNTVSPGAFPNKTVQQKEGFIQELEKNIPLSRVGQPDELAGIFVYLSSKAASYTTGQNFVIDGGWTIK